MAVHLPPPVFTKSNKGFDSVNSKERFNLILELASTLNWSKSKDDFYEYFTRMMVEHIFRTSIADSLKNFHEPTLKKSILESLTTHQNKVKIDLIELHNLLNYYVDPLLQNSKQRRTHLQSSGTKCAWFLGCPVEENMELKNITSQHLTQYVNLEDDHVFPTSHATAPTNLSQKLCGHHNTKWKINHLALGLPRDFFHVRKL